MTRWTEIQKGPSGISVTLYDVLDGETIVVDEYWEPWAELLGSPNAGIPGLPKESTVTLE